jgi:hypothetical protein
MSVVLEDNNLAAPRLAADPSCVTESFVQLSRYSEFA